MTTILMRCRSSSSSSSSYCPSLYRRILVVNFPSTMIISSDAIVRRSQQQQQQSITTVTRTANVLNNNNSKNNRNNINNFTSNITGWLNSINNINNNNSYDDCNCRHSCSRMMRIFFVNNNRRRSYVSRAHPKPTPEYNIRYAIDELLIACEQRQERRYQKYIQNKQKYNSLLQQQRKQQQKKQEKQQKLAVVTTVEEENNNNSNNEEEDSTTTSASDSVRHGEEEDDDDEAETEEESATVVAAAKTSSVVAKEEEGEEEDPVMMSSTNDDEDDKEEEDTIANEEDKDEEEEEEANEERIEKDKERMMVTMKEFSKVDETVELIMNLNLDPRKQGQAVRGSISLPNGTGKKKSSSTGVVVFTTDEELAQSAKNMGAIDAGGNELIDRIMNGELSVDMMSRSLATPEIMSTVSKKCGRILGPRNLMPNSKVGTIIENHTDLLRTLQTLLLGRDIQYRTDPNGILHMPVGKASFGTNKLLENIERVLKTIYEAKPESYGKSKKKSGGSSKKKKKASKGGKYVLRASITTTQGKGYRLDIRTIDPASPFFLSTPTFVTTTNTTTTSASSSASQVQIQ